MRRTMNVNEWTVSQIMNSKMDWDNVLNILENTRGNSDNLEFKASEVGLKGAQMRVLMDMRIVKVVRTEECWFKIDEDTMKRGSVNVYSFDVEVSELMDEIRKEKRKKIYEEIAKLKARIYELTNELNEM